MAAFEKEQMRQQWQAQFRKAQQHDTWGQVLEAQEEYQTMAAAVAGAQVMPSMTSKERDIMHKLSMCLSARVQALRTLNESITALDMKALEPVLETLFTGAEPAAFPVDAFKYQAAQPVRPQIEGEIVCGEAEEPYTGWQQHQAVLKSVTGTIVSLRIEKIGLKDAQDYIDPFMTVLVADTRQNLLDTHDTPIAKERRATHVVFNHQIWLNLSLEEMQRHQAAIFFEFKHYKPMKKKISTRCWAFMELGELKRDEEMVLEIYHKPTDLKKKKLSLHSEKQLYLHLYATLVQN